MAGEQHVTYGNLCDAAERRGLHVELLTSKKLLGANGCEYRNIEKLRVVRITPRGVELITERPVHQHHLDKAAAGCLGFLEGSVPQ